MWDLFPWWVITPRVAVSVDRIILTSFNFSFTGLATVIFVSDTISFYLWRLSSINNKFWKQGRCRVGGPWHPQKHQPTAVGQRSAWEALSLICGGLILTAKKGQCMWGWQHAEYHLLRENSGYVSALGVESKHCPWLSCTHQGRGSSELLSLISLNPDSQIPRK